MKFQEALLGNCIVAGAPRTDDAAIVIDGRKLTSGIVQLLAIANGMITNDRFFRVFGTVAISGIPSLEEWNRSEWKNEYGKLASEMIFVAEDIFGDQYGYQIRPGGQDFVKFFCEGGDVQILDGGINRLIESLINPASTKLLDLDLARAALKDGKHPRAVEHLAFRVPLVVGGEYALDNLQVESVELHMGTIAQMTAKNTSLPEGTRICVFRGD